jgi:AbrB family looped-hinge helix DNA binding protein
MEGGVALADGIDDTYFKYILRNMKVGERGQITIPLDLRKRFGLKPFSEVEVLEEKNQLVIRKKLKPCPLGKFSGVLKGTKVRAGRTDEWIEALRGR